MKDKILKWMEWNRPFQIIYDKNTEGGSYHILAISILCRCEIELTEVDSVYSFTIGFNTDMIRYHCKEGRAFMWPNYDKYVV